MIGLTIYNGFYFLVPKSGPDPYAAIFLTTAGFLTLIGAIAVACLIMSVSVFGTGLDGPTVLRIGSIALIVGILFKIDFPIILGAPINKSFQWQIGVGLISNLIDSLGTADGVFMLFAWLAGALVSVVAIGTGIIAVMQNG